MNDHQPAATLDVATTSRLAREVLEEVNLAVVGKERERQKRLGW